MAEAIVASSAWVTRRAEGGGGWKVLYEHMTDSRRYRVITGEVAGGQPKITANCRHRQDSESFWFVELAGRVVGNYGDPRLLREMLEMAAGLPDDVVANLRAVSAAFD